MAINWNTVPCFYNDSYTYMEWLGKVTAKVEEQETRLTQAEADIDQLQEDVAGIQSTLEDHENRLTTAEGDIDNLEDAVDNLEDALDSISDTVTTLNTWYTEYGQEAVTYVWQNMSKIDTALNTSIPALQQQTAENTAAIISIQREGTTVYIDVTEDTTISSITDIATTYTPLSPTEYAVDMVYRISATINSNAELFTIREMVHVGDTVNGIAFNADGYITYSVDLTTAGAIAITLGSSYISGQAYADTDITASDVAQADVILYAQKSVTPTSEKEAYQASVRIFTDKDIPLDSRTASIITQYYSAASVDPDLTWAAFCADYNTEHSGGLQLDPTSYPDTNKDGKINAIDATNVLTYYSNASTGKTQYLNSDADKFYNWYLDGNPPRWEY